MDFSLQGWLSDTLYLHKYFLEPDYNAFITASGAFTPQVAPWTSMEPLMAKGTSPPEERDHYSALIILNPKR